MIVNSFLGIHNQNHPRSIPDNALADAVDVDIDNAGTILQRPGYVQSQAITNVTSAYSTVNQEGYVVASGTLYRIQDDLSLIPLATSTATQFSDVNGILFTNDGLKIDSDNVVDIKISAPEIPPDLTITAGNLEPGTYSACYCFRSASGLEGGSSPIATVELTSAAGMAITPVTPPSGLYVNYYLTDCNGTVYYDANGAQLNPVQILAESYPDNIEVIAYHESRLWISKALPNKSSIVWFSAPFHYHLYNLEANYIIVPGHIRAMASASDALIIATNDGIYAYNDALVKLADYGVPKGRSMTRTTSGEIMIYTNRGVCVGLPFRNVSDKKVLFPPGEQCSTALVEENGMRKFVTLSDGYGTPYNSRL